METNPNITRLLEMLENPEIYTEQEILDIINSDEEPSRVTDASRLPMMSMPTPPGSALSKRDCKPTAKSQPPALLFPTPLHTIHS